MTIRKLFCTLIFLLSAASEHATAKDTSIKKQRFSTKKSYKSMDSNLKTVKLIPGTQEYEDYMNNEDMMETINSQKAFIYSTIFPGLGQIYNEKYVRAAVIWGVMGSLIAGAYYCQLEYIRFTHESNKDAFVKTYKKVRDGLLFVTVICYIANIFEAYVGAELRKYNISDDISVEIVPSAHAAGNNSNLGLSLAFRFS